MQVRRAQFRWNKDDELFEDMVVALHEAALRGYSVVELSRIMGNSTCKNLYAIMRDAGIYAKLPRKRWGKFDVHPALAEALDSCKLSFAQWVNTHDLDLTATVHVLKTAVNLEDPQSVAAHNALQQDFRFLSMKMYGLPVPPARVSEGTDDQIITDYTITIEPNRTAGKYRAYIHELPECEVSARTRDLAYFGLKSRYVFFHSIRKLKVLPQK